ncbi:hypothetical protein D3C73_1330890 [compost metagenome]
MQVSAFTVISLERLSPHRPDLPLDQHLERTQPRHRNFAGRRIFKRLKAKLAGDEGRYSQRLLPRQPGIFASSDM